MTSRLNIHIGYPRTGTTSLQTTLSECSDLLGEHDIFVPPSIGNRHRHLQALGEIEINPNVCRILGIDDTSNAETFLDNWIDGVAAVSKHFSLTIMSEEMIALRDKESLIGMKGKLDKHFDSIKIFVCFREHQSYLKSEQQQSVRASFRNDTLEKFVEKFGPRPHMRYVHTIKTLINVFGKQNVNAFHYSAAQDQSSNERILSSISDKVLQDVSIPRELNHTRNIHPDALEFKRLTNAVINRALAELNYAPSGKTHERFLELVGPIFDTCAHTPAENPAPAQNPIYEKHLIRWQKDWAELNGEKYKSNFDN